MNSYNPTEDLKKYSPDFDWSKYDVVKDNWGNWIWKNDKGHWHNENGPARIGKTGNLAWCIDNKSHRDDGPAWVWLDGECWYYIYDEGVTEEEYWQWYYTQQTIKFMTGAMK